MDPTRRRSGGALLGDRIRMNSLSAENIFMRSLATRRAHLATSAVLKDVIELYKAAGFDLVIVETAGIGQSDTEIVDLVDLSLYVMTSEYGAASQLEKIDMLDLRRLHRAQQEREARRRGQPARRAQAVAPQPSGRRAPRDAEVPVFPTIASRFNDPGVNQLFAAVARRSPPRTPAPGQLRGCRADRAQSRARPLMPGERSRYLAEIAQGGRRGARAHRGAGQRRAPRRRAVRGAEVAARCAAARAA